ncbi:MAG: helix-turn-helix domain-containing protein, partial [Gammaproteobacteria bacterium]|nr:helix-turn-helix domain-containing protein [Gammaproteobacteria bacterium]
MINPIVNMGSSVKIGELAKSVGCHVETVRYYEKEGMLPEPPRSESGYRIYTPQHLRQLRLIRRAKELGFSQDQIKSLIRLSYDVDDPCDDVYELTVAQVANVDNKIKELKRLKSALISMKKACEAGNHKSCPSLD